MASVITQHTYTGGRGRGILGMDLSRAFRRPGEGGGEMQQRRQIGGQGKSSFSICEEDCIKPWVPVARFKVSKLFSCPLQKQTRRWNWGQSYWWLVSTTRLTRMLLAAFQSYPWRRVFEIHNTINNVIKIIRLVSDFGSDNNFPQADKIILTSKVQFFH